MRHYSIKTLLNPPEAVPVWVVRAKNRMRPEPPHTHDCMEVMYIRGGVASCRINNRRYPVVRGDFYVIAPGDIHEFSISGELNFDTLLFSLDIFTDEERRFLAANPLFSSWINPGNAGEKKLNFHLAAAEELERLFGELIAECTRPGPVNNMLRRSIFICLLFFAINHGVAGGVEPSGKNLQLSNLLDYINRHSREVLSLEQLAKAANVSVNYLNEFMQRSIGQGAMEYLHRVRVEKARHALEHSDLTVGEIAAETGFYDASHLVRIFKKYTGVTPGKYRKLCAR